MKLRPGMTANVEIITAQKDDVLLVPNQALRFFMEDENGGSAKRYKDKGIWVLKNREPVRVTVKTGVSDDNNTEVISDALKIGDEVIIEKKSSAKNKSAMRMRMPR